MNEKAPQPSPEQQFVGREIQDAIFEEREISDSAARVIAGWWHGGQASAFYSFASCGAIDRERITDEYVMAYADEGLSPFDRVALDYFGTYLLHAEGIDDAGNRAPVEGWHEATQWEQA